MTVPSSARPDADTERLIAQLRTRCEALERRRAWDADELARQRAESEASLRRLLTGLLDVDDALAESVRWSAGQDSNRAAATMERLIEQVCAAHRLLRRRLLEADVRPMDLTHRHAVPDVARVVDTRPTSRCPADTVMEERVAGFYLGQQVLRTAEVVVAVPGPEPDAPEEAAGEKRSGPAAPRRQPRRLPRHRRRSRRRS
ncbi:nucleotide exchange factor GrpE [Streptomyces sp. Vc74B-19]|uniref:nucleotide exchange factor GrpE n=1 Tax=Streptomyces sp. Vc74B-19 TaxID=2741324 RepID=UPI001BFC6298|nr:nucleotide exchange factor GrpE [Streptomyces sp. Vc74B-19]MBT3163791.1 nucleotide exchange factor GrpE [Streptomyces sp. Vc74B-19]